MWEGGAEHIITGHHNISGYALEIKMSRMNKTWHLSLGHYILGKRYLKKLVTKVYHVSCDKFKEGVVDYTLVVVRKVMCERGNVFSKKRY